jgi:hypothetical protein
MHTRSKDKFASQLRKITLLANMRRMSEGLLPPYNDKPQVDKTGGKVSYPNTLCGIRKGTQYEITPSLLAGRGPFQTLNIHPKFTVKSSGRISEDSSFESCRFLGQIAIEFRVVGI